MLGPLARGRVGLTFAIRSFHIRKFHIRNRKRRRPAHQHGSSTTDPAGEPRSTDARTSSSPGRGLKKTETKTETKTKIESPIPFNPGDAIESLRAEIVQIEAFAHAASEAMTRLPYPSARAARRAYDRVYALVMRVADDASAAVRRGDALVAALTDQLHRRRTDN